MIFNKLGMHKKLCEGFLNEKQKKKQIEIEMINCRNRVLLLIVEIANGLKGNRTELISKVNQ